MAHAQKQHFVLRRNGRVHLNRRGRQFSRLQAAEVCASMIVMLDTPSSEVVWRVLATHSIHQFPLHFPSRASPCATTFQLVSTSARQTRGGNRTMAFPSAIFSQQHSTHSEPQRQKCRVFSCRRNRTKLFSLLMNLEIRAENDPRTEPCGMSSGILNIWRGGKEEKTMEPKLFFKLSGTSWWKTSKEYKNKRLSVDSRMQEVIFRSNDSCKGKTKHCHTSSFVKLPRRRPIICTQSSRLAAARGGESEEDIQGVSRL